MLLMCAGVRVNIMIWDEIDSGDDFLAYTKVSKMLHGGGATEYFKDTQVSVKLMPRKSVAPQVTSLFCHTLCALPVLCISCCTQRLSYSMIVCCSSDHCELMCIRFAGIIAHKNALNWTQTLSSLSLGHCTVLRCLLF